MGDGLPKLLTDPAFISLVTEHEENREIEARAKVARGVARLSRKAELAAWEAAKVVRAEANLVLVNG